MFFSRLVSLREIFSCIIFIACISSQVHSMISVASRTGRHKKRSLCSGAAASEHSRIGLKLLAVGTIGVTAGAIKWLLDNKKIHEEEVSSNQEKIAAMQAFIELFLVEKNDLESFIKQCINIGMNPNDFVTATGMTALMFACKSGNTVAATILIDEGDIDLNAQDFFGRSALSLAISYEKDEIVSLLLCQKNIKTDTQAITNVLHRSKHPEIKAMFEAREALIINRMNQYSDENRK